MWCILDQILVKTGKPSVIGILKPSLRSWFCDADAFFFLNLACSSLPKALIAQPVGQRCCLVNYIYKPAPVDQNGGEKPETVKSLLTARLDVGEPVKAEFRHDEMRVIVSV